MELIGKFFSPEQFVTFQTPDYDLFRYAWGSRRKDEIGHGSFALIHAPSYWDDYLPEHKIGEDAFYEALRQAYEQYKVHWVKFVYWPDENK